MSNKKLIQQYATTGIDLPEYQFYKLSDNIKKSYLRSRINGYHHEDSPLSEFEMENIKLAPEESIKQYLTKIPSYALGTKYFLKVNGGLNNSLPDTNFILNIDFNDVGRYIKSDMGDDDIESLLMSDYDMHFAYDSDAYTYAYFDSKNEEFIKKYITQISNGDIAVDDIAEALNEFKHEYDTEIVDIVNSSVQQSIESKFISDATKSIIGAFEEWGDTAISYDNGIIIIKTNFFDVVNMSDFYPHELDEHIYDVSDNNNKFEYIDVIYELISVRKIDELDVSISSDGDYDTDLFNEILTDNLGEL